MTMIERENENISAVNSGCRPKALVLAKPEISAAIESFSDEIEEPNLESSCESVSHQAIEFCNKNQPMAAKNLHDLDLKPTSQLVVEAPTKHRSKHVRSFSDCTGLSSVSSKRHQPPPLIQTSTNIQENAQGLN